jgi:hypothetical protein
MVIPHGVTTANRSRRLSAYPLTGLPNTYAEDEYWAGCGGMLTQQQYRDLLLGAGFTGITITSTHEAGPGLHSATVNAAKPAAPHT